MRASASSSLRPPQALRGGVGARVLMGARARQAQGDLETLPEECEWLLRGFLSPELFERGLICRADYRGDPVIQISPPLVAGDAEFDELVRILTEVLDEAWQKLGQAPGAPRRETPRRAP